MRLFLALDAHELDADLKKLKMNLNKAKNMEHRWVPADQWHIPIFPLGDIGHEKFKLMDDLISTSLSGQAPFELKMEGVWAYPSQDHGRLLWIGVQNSKELRHLQTQLVKVFGPHYSESADEKPFRPHLPVVRLKNFREVSDLISPYKNSDFGKVLISRAFIYEMTSGGAFPTYKKIKGYELKSSENLLSL